MLSRFDTGYFCLVPDLRGKAFSICCCCRIFVGGLCQVQEVLFYPQFAESFYQEKMDFLKCFFCIFWEDHKSLFF